jgi:hypothetical protein
MPVEILTAAQRAEWERFPAEIDEAALSAYFSLSDDELEAVAALRDLHARFAVAATVGALRWLGTVPAALDELPEPAAALVAEQLDIDLESIHADRLDVGPRARGRHLERATAISGFRELGPDDGAELQAWLEERALGHDGPLALLRGTVDRLRRQALLRPGLTTLERMVAGARTAADLEIPATGPDPRDGAAGGAGPALVVAAGEQSAPVKQLGQETRKLARLAEPLAKLELLRRLGAETWDLSTVPANRLRMLAQYVDHASSQAIGRREPAFRYPALLAFCAEASARVTDEIVDLLDDGITNQHASARRALVREKLEVSDSANASVVLLGELLEVLLDPEIPDPQVRQAVWKRATPQELQQALELAESIKRPLQDNPRGEAPRALPLRARVRPVDPRRPEVPRHPRRARAAGGRRAAARAQPVRGAPRPRQRINRVRAARLAALRAPARGRDRPATTGSSAS